MLGIGHQPLGLSLAGLGGIEDADELPTQTSGARFIGPDGDRMIDPATGDFARMSDVQQRVLIALVTQLGSATVDFNMGTTRQTKMDDTFEARETNSALAALRSLIDNKEIEVISVVVTRDGGRATRAVTFRNLSNGKEETIKNRVI